MKEASRSDLERCLAYEILCNYDSWLGVPSPRGLQCALLGASARASLTAPSFQLWRIFGPLDEPDFYKPIVARTGHPRLSIRWATAMEILHFSLAEAMEELQTLVRDWFEGHGFDPEQKVGDPFHVDGVGAPDEDEFWRAMAKRPGMFLGGCSGVALQHYLTGMDRGGDWLGLPVLPKVRDVVARIEERSEGAYGTRFGAYRVYEDGAQDLLGWAGFNGTL